MNSNVDDSEYDSFKNLFLNENSQSGNFEEKNEELDNDRQNLQILRAFLLNQDLCHRNLCKMVDFGINRSTYGPFEFGVQFNAKYFINIIREYYLKLNCQRMNFIVKNQIIYFYSHYQQRFQIITKINTHYINPDLCKIIEGHRKELRANFDLIKLLKNLELRNYSNKENIKIFFKFNKNKKNEKTFNVNNPYNELREEDAKFEKEFNFEDVAIPGNIIIESFKEFKFNLESNFAPLEQCAPPHIPSSIYSDYIFFISLDKLSYCTQRMNLQSPIDIYCNHYICNFISNSTSENFLIYKNTEGVDFKFENGFKYFKLYDPIIERGNLFKKMIKFTLTKPELDACKIINKKNLVIYFYADKMEKYYFSKETDQDGNITSSIILKSKENMPIIKEIEECCLYIDHWEEWLIYLSNNLTKDCINFLREARKNKGIKNIVSVSNNKKNRKKVNKQLDEDMKENNSEDKKNIKNKNNRNEEIAEDEKIGSIVLYGSNKKGYKTEIKFEENNNGIKVEEKASGQSNNNINENPGNIEQNKNNVMKNPFEF